jgi:hypothetical protein
MRRDPRTGKPTRSDPPEMVRTLWYQADLDDPNNPGNCGGDYPLSAVISKRKPCVMTDEHQANLVSSLTQTGLHAPVIDLDLPARLVPSRTTGHSHLYIDHELIWTDYLDLLKALAQSGIVEPNYVAFTETRGMSFARLDPESRPPRRSEPDFPFSRP